MIHDPMLGDAAELVALFLVGAMPPDEHRDFEAHLASGCEECLVECRKYANALEGLSRGIAPIEPDPSTRARLLERIAAGPPPREPSRPTSRRAQRNEGAAPAPTIRRAARAKWRPASLRGVLIRVLRSDPERDRLTALVRMDAGARIPPHAHDGPEELLILEGDFRVGADVFLAGDYLHYPMGSLHEESRSELGCVALIIMPMNATGGILEPSTAGA